MHREKKDKKAREVSSKAVVASLTEEMTQPRIAKSARADVDEQGNERLVKPTTQRTNRAPKPHIEQYGTGTPAVEKKS
jgi:hypothetical protein